MSTVQCLAIYGTRKVAINVSGEHKLQDVKCALEKSTLQAELSPCFSSLRIQAYNSLFNDFVEMDDSTVVELGQKLMLIVDEPNIYDQTPPSRQIATIDQVEEPITVQRSEGPRATQLGPYVLSTLPYHLKEEIHGIKAGKISPSLRVRLVRFLHSDICQYETYPAKRNLYYECARQLVLEYPVLKDRTGPGFDSWQRAVKFRTKNQRRRSDNFEVAHYRENARLKGIRRKECGSTQATAPLKRRRTPLATLGNAGPPQPSDTGVSQSLDMDPSEPTDAATHEQLIHSMREEMGKATPSSARIKLFMVKTFHDRRKWITGGNHTVQAVSNEYPALRLESEILREMSRIVPDLINGECLQDRLLKFLNKHGGTLLTIARTKKAAAKYIEQYEKASEQNITSDEKKYYFAVTILCCIPALLKESTPRMLTETATPLPVYPLIVAQDLFVHGSPVQVCLQDISIQVQDLVAAVPLLLSLFWVFDLKYTPRLHNSYAVLEHVLLKTTDCPYVLASCLIKQLE